MWIPVFDEAATTGALLGRGWVVAPGAAYRLPGSAPAIRITIATLGDAECDRLADDLAELLDVAGSTRSG